MDGFGQAIKQIISKSKSAEEELQQVIENLKVKVKEIEENGQEPNPEEVKTIKKEATYVNSRMVRTTTRLRKDEGEAKFADQNPLEQKVIDLLTDIFK